MTQKLLLGDEAVGQAAIDAGISGAFSYPGTPSTEIFEYIQRLASSKGVAAKWSGNEKVAYEEALGMSYIGKRSIVSMKCVGLNVAADPFMCSALANINGGLVVVVADDPGMHSSQNEQDSRHYAHFAKIPCFEPGDEQECYDMTREAFRLSEKYHVPVMVRLVTRLAHSRAKVEPRSARNTRQDLLFKKDFAQWTLLPVNARKQFEKLIRKHEELREYSDSSPWNRTFKAVKSKKGIICAGVGLGYLKDAFAFCDKEAPYLAIGCYPLPIKKISDFLKGKQEILVIEDGYPYIEDYLLGCAGKGPVIIGRKTGALPSTGELDPDSVIEAVSSLLKTKKIFPKEKHVNIPKRPPSLCPGCPHIDTYKALNEARKDKEPCVVFSDIGCYTLGALPPHSAIDTCVEMGASIGMAKGASDGGLKYAVAVLGDSTFEHSGIVPLLGAAVANTPITVLILDNLTVGMTGTQTTLAQGDRILELVRGLGIDKEHIRLLNPIPKNHEENAGIISQELDFAGLSVIISRRECVQSTRRKLKSSKDSN
ncbi:thiamine pyrophosphate-dependent enzyme [Elusimicrobiota bacterium]